MELEMGVPITKHCADANLHIGERLELFTDVCAAVQHAHQKGIIHRDLKPSNILVAHHDGEPVVKVIDFGIAKAIGPELTVKTLFTQLGRMIGTPQYMSPEQAEPNAPAVDTRSDIYSLGVILYELLTGTTPLDEERLRNTGFAEMQRLIREVTPPRPSARPRPGVTPRALRGDLDWIALKALEKDPSRRYESAGALAEDITRFLQHKPVEARPPSMTYLMLRFTRRHRGPVFASAALLIALLMGAVGTSIGMKRALDAKEELERKNQELDRQKLELVDYKERLAGLLESNQKMLDEIRRVSTNEAQLPAEFEALRNENRALLNKVKNEVANQERYAEEIERLRLRNARLEKMVGKNEGGEMTVESVRAELFNNSTTSLHMNERGQFYHEGKLIPYPTLLKAFATPPDEAERNGEGKLVVTATEEGCEDSVPRWLSVKLPMGSEPTDAVFHSRLKEIAAAADQMGLRHRLFSRPGGKPDK